MDQVAALRLAIDLRQVPSRVRIARCSALPEGVPLLLRLASGDDEAAESCIKSTGRTAEFLREAATFFIEQVLLAPDSDSYRVLGATPDASASDLRRNMALLLRWLHPDVASCKERSIFAGRITAAWEDLKTPERRASYDSSRRSGGPTRASTQRRHRQRTTGSMSAFRSDPRQRPPSRLKRTIWRLLGRPS